MCPPTVKYVKKNTVDKTGDFAINHNRMGVSKKAIS